MITVKNAIDSISERLSIFSNYIALQNGANHYDNNTASERLFIPILNTVYDLNLQDLNIQRSNYPAIDLSDATNRFCVQVTSENNTRKLKSTLATLRRHNLIKDYDNLLFLVLSTDETGIATDPDVDIEIINLKKLMTKITMLSMQKILFIDEYVQNNLQYTHAINNSVLIPQIPTVNDDEINTEKMVIELGIQNELELRQILINDLKKLLFMLKSLNHDQKLILYYIVLNSKFDINSSGYKEDDLIYMPSVELEQKIPGSHPYVQILINEGLISVDLEYVPYGVEYTITVLEANFFGDYEVNLLARIKKLCESYPMDLQSILVDLDFSKL